MSSTAQSLRNVEGLLFEGGIDVCHKWVRQWWNRFGSVFAAEIRKKRAGFHHSCVQWRWHLDEAFVRISGRPHSLTCGHRPNNRAETSDQPFRRREGAMAGVRDVKTLQTFAGVHASIHNPFNQDRHLNRRGIFKSNRSAALAGWRQLAA